MFIQHQQKVQCSHLHAASHDTNFPTLTCYFVVNLGPGKNFGHCGSLTHLFFGNTGSYSQCSHADMLQIHPCCDLRFGCLQGPQAITSRRNSSGAGSLLGKVGCNTSVGSVKVQCVYGCWCLFHADSLPYIHGWALVAVRSKILSFSYSWTHHVVTGVDASDTINPCSNLAGWSVP